MRHVERERRLRAHHEVAQDLRHGREGEDRESVLFPRVLARRVDESEAVYPALDRSEHAGTEVPLPLEHAGYVVAQRHRREREEREEERGERPETGRHVQNLSGRSSTKNR
jgi:hypothetical protein